MYASFSPPFAFVPESDDEGAAGDDGDDVEIEYTPTGGQSWDGRADSIAKQAQGPFTNPREMNNPDSETVVTKVRAAAYAPLFEEVYGKGALAGDDVFDQATAAIAAFEKSTRFNPFASKFDRFLRGEIELAPNEARGFELFKAPDKGNCISCHAGDVESNDPHDWLFTDFTYDNLGVPRNYDIPDNADDDYFDLGLCEADGISERLPEGVTADQWCGAFKVPTLRNVALTAPYAHNGFFRDLHDMVRFYVTRDVNPALWYPKAADGTILKFDDVPEQYRANVNTEEVPYDRGPGENPRLNDDEIDDLVAFLQTLNDE